MRSFSSVLLFLFLGLLSVKAQQISTLCSDITTATLTATCNDGTAPYTYEWENPSGTVVESDEISVTVAGIYSWLCTDANGCIKTGTHQIIFETLPTVTINAINTCVSNSQVITATGVTAGYTYEWDLDGGTPSSSTSNNPSVFWATSGTKTITLTISKTTTGGCGSTCSVEVDTTITISGPIGDIGCSTLSADTCYTSVCDSAILTSSFNPAFTHSWVSNLGQSSSSVNPSFLLAGDEEVFTLTVTDGDCIATRTVVVVNCPEGGCDLVVNIELSGNILLASEHNCEGTPLYQWYKKISGVWTAISPFGNWSYYNTLGVSAEYKVVVECAFDCIGEDSINFVAPCTTLAINNFYQNQVVETGLCNAFNSKTYSFYQESFLGSGIWALIHTATTNAITYGWAGPGAGSYRVDVTGCGCTLSKYYVNGPCQGVVFGSVVPATACTGQVVSFTASPVGSTVAWFVNGVSIPGSSYTFPAVGVYTVQANITTPSGCSGVVVKTITISDCCVASNTVSPSTPTICENGTQTFTTTPTSGTGPYTYQWYYKLSSSSIWMAASTGSTYIFTIPTAGVYNIKAVMTTSTGCTSEGLSTITVTECIDCECTPSIAIVGCVMVVTFTGDGCDGAFYSLQQWNGSTWLAMAPIAVVNFTYTPLFNTLYRVVRTKTGCAQSISNVVNITCYVPGCENPPTLSLADNQSSCTLNPVIFTGNTIGGGATTATATHTGLGVATFTWVTSTNFTLTYTPALGDAGVTVAITITTNSPPSPCNPAAGVLTVAYIPEPAVDITSSIADLCLSASRTITYTPSGGTLSVSGPGTLSGNILTSTGAGNITVTYSYVLAGCTTAVAQIIRSIQCVPTLALSGCTLNGTSTGVGCSTFTYNLEYSTTGTGGWSTVATGTAGSFTYSPTSNGFYRIVNVHPVCNDPISNIINVACLSECVCTPSINLASCVITWGACSGYTTQLQRLISSTWTNISGTSPYSPPIDGSYRVVYTKTGCPTLTSSTVVHNNICESEFSFTEEGVDYYLPNCYYFPDANYQAIGTVNRKVNFYATVCGSTNLGEYLFDWGDGSTRTGIYNDITPHTYASNGERTIAYTRTINSNNLAQNIWVNANTTEPNIPRAYIEPNCADGVSPILYTYSSTCNTVNVFVSFKFTTRNYTPTYTSHFVKINGTTYTVPISFTTTGTNTTWYIASAVGIPLTVSSSVYSVEASLTFDGKTVTNKGYFYVCNSSCVEDNCNEPEYTFQVDPVAPAPQSYIFDRDISTDPWLEDATPSCAPYDTYIMGGTGNTWDFVVTASSPITWSYSHYNGTLAPNLTEVSRTSTSIRFHLLGASNSCGGCGAVPPVTPVCGTNIVNAMMRLIGRDSCNNVVYDRIFLKYNNN